MEAVYSPVVIVIRKLQNTKEGRYLAKSRPREQQQRRSVNPSPPKKKLGHELYGVRSTEYILS